MFALFWFFLGVGLRAHFIEDHGHRRAEQEKRNAQQLTHGEIAEEETDLLIRLAEQFDKGSEQSVTSDEYPEEHTGGCLGAADHPEDQEQYRSFEKSLVELRRMAGQGAAGGENDAPGHVRDPSIQFAVDEIAESAETEPDWSCRGDQVGDLEEADLVLVRIIERRDYRADQPAMERHPPLPDGKYLQRVGKIVRSIVKENVAESCSDNQADGQGEDQVGDVVLGEGQFFALCRGNGDQVGCQETEDVHKSVPADLQGADLENIGFDIGELHGESLQSCKRNDC